MISRRKSQPKKLRGEAEEEEEDQEHAVPQRPGEEHFKERVSGQQGQSFLS